MNRDEVMLNVGILFCNYEMRIDDAMSMLEFADEKLDHKLLWLKDVAEEYLSKTPVPDAKSLHDFFEDRLVQLENECK